MTLRLVPNSPTPTFHRHIGITYSGAETPDSGLKGLRIGLAVGEAPAADVAPPPGPRRYWTRRLRRRLAGRSADVATTELRCSVG